MFLHFILLFSSLVVHSRAENITEVALANGNFNTLLSNLDDPFFATALETVGQITIFGPTDAAFEKDAALVANAPNLNNLLGGHVVLGNHTLDDFKAKGCTELTTFGQSKIKVWVMEHDGMDDMLMVNNGRFFLMRSV